MKTIRFALPGCLLLFSLHGRAAEPVRLACPEVVKASSIKVEGQAAGWAARASADFRLHSAGFNDGPPENHVDLKPWSVSSKRRQTVEVWRFDAADFADGVWLVCGYGGAQGRITLAKKLSSSYSTCSVTYGTNTLGISCR